MSLASAVVQILAAHPHAAAATVSWAASALLYGVLGRRYLTADDDFWPRLRRVLLPVLDRLAQGTPGLYATATTLDSEIVGFAVVDDVDSFERTLEAAGFTRNPLASYKTLDGLQSDGSWADRYGTVAAGLLTSGRLLRLVHERTSERMSSVTWVSEVLGRLSEASGEIFARRQLHCWFFAVEIGDHTVVLLAAHDEFNSLNPVTAFPHLSGVQMRRREGVTDLRERLDDEGEAIHRSVEDLAVALSVPSERIRAVLSGGTAPG
jgi:hypothetical protein